MKEIIFINGAMGVGKTAVSGDLKELLPAAVRLDGDWCWDMSPFVVSNETKAMVTDNITYLLNSFIHCSAYENIIFCWVMHELSIIKEIESRLELKDCRLSVFTLVCTETALIERLEEDIRRGIRTRDVIPRALDRLSRYAAMPTEKLDVTNLSAHEAALAIHKRLAEGGGALSARTR